MARTGTETHPLLNLEARALGIGLVAGVVAGLGMGVVLQFGTDILPVLGAFAGQVSLVRGWVVHFLISALYGVLFAVVVAYPPVMDFLDTFGFREYVFAGITYAVMIAAVTIGVLPFVSELPWIASTEWSIEFMPGPGLSGLAPAAMFGVAHLVYGAILGAVYERIGPTRDSPDR